MKAVSWENLSAGLRETIERACTPAELEVMKIKVEHGDVVGDRSIACTTGRRRLTKPCGACFSTVSRSTVASWTR